MTLESRFRAHPGNFGSRRGVKPDLVVLHTTESGATSALRWFADERAKASAHYVLGPSGLVFEVVPEAMCAWHCGNRDYNHRSVGIEVAGYHDRADTWTDPVVESLGRLVGDICRRNDIPVDRAHIIGHSEVPSPDGKHMGGLGRHVDPGVLTPYERIIDIARTSVQSVS